MKQDTKVALIIILIAVIITVGIFIVKVRGKKEKTNEPTGETNTTQQEKKEKEENVKEYNDGTKLNTSNKLQKEKKIEGLEIGDIQLTEKDQVALFLATVTNTSQEEQGGYLVDIKLVNKKGEEIETIPGYIKKLQPGESTQLSTTIAEKIVNAYDCIITKAESQSE